MERREILAKLTQNEDEKLLLGRIWDKYDQCRSRNIPSATAFLSPQEQMLARRLLQKLGEERAVFYGGYEGAERCRLCFLPDWQEEAAEELVCAVRATFYEKGALTHRDVLGALMGQQITRESVGDLLVSPDHIDVLVSDTVADFLVQNWDSAGRVALKTERIPLSEVEVPAQQVKEIRDTVATLRLDAVLASGFSLSRGRAAEAIEAGRVQLNWQLCQKTDAHIAEGDVLTVRGLGKCKVAEVGNQTRKGRIFLTLLRYL